LNRFFSHSSLSTFEQCPARFKFIYLDRIRKPFEGIESFVGRRVHETLEFLYQEGSFYFIEMNMGHVIKLGKPFYLTLSYVVIFPGLASFFFWIKGIALIGANRAGVFLHLMPIFGAIMAMIIFDEKFMFYHFLGAIFIIAGIILSNKKTINNV